VSDAAGGRTRVTGLVTAAAVAFVLVFLTGPLQYVPSAALGAVLVGAAFSLLDLKALGYFYRVDRRELALSVVATLGVASVGAVKAIFVAVILALLRFVKVVSRPKVEILGRVPGLPGLHYIDRHQDAITIPGLLLLRFNAPIVFFNAPFFRRSVLEAVDAATTQLKWLVVDMIPITVIDTTGLQTVRDVIDTLGSRGVTFIAAGRETEWKHWAESRGLKLGHRMFPTLDAAIDAFEHESALSGEPRGT